MHQRQFALLLLCLLFLCNHWACKTSPSGVAETPQPPNVLFIAIDDLRPELGCYGNDLVKSPNIDRLANAGFLFNRHYVAVPTCGASRYALVTGMLPSEPEHVRNSAIATYLSEKPETDRPESFIHQLRRNGYYTLGIGKISHMPDGFVYGYQEEPSTIKEMPHSWDEFLFNSDKWKSGHNAFFGYADGTNRNDLNKQVKPYEAADVPDEGYPDGLTTKLALEKLPALAKKDQPFFMAVGFFKPHLPFTAPKKYWDLYDEAAMPLSPSPGIPENVNEASLHGSGEFNQYALGEEKAGLDHNMSDAYSRKMMHAYYACVSYIDAQVGKLVAALKDQGLDDNTIIIIWGDHGWHLGDQRVWGKHTVMERALKSAFMIKLPGEQHQARVFDEIVSTVDIYPTILDFCGVDAPHPTDGTSLRGLWDPDIQQQWRNTAYSYFRNRGSIRTDRYRLNYYNRTDLPTIELFDYQLDPLGLKNIADQEVEIVQELMSQLEKGGTSAFTE